MKKTEYSAWIGLVKSLKNWCKIAILPILVYLASDLQAWMPPETLEQIAPFTGIISYFVANYYSNK